jgi:hypothetical protein
MEDPEQIGEALSKNVNCYFTFNDPKTQEEFKEYLAFYWLKFYPVTTLFFVPGVVYAIIFYAMEPEATSL